MKSQDVKKSNSGAIKNMMDLEGNLSTFHYGVMSLFGLHGHSSKYELKPNCCQNCTISTTAME